MDGWVDGWMDRTSDMNSASRLPIGPCPGRPFRTTARVASVARVACLARSNVCIELRPAGPIAQRRARLAGLGLSDPQGLQGGQGRGEGQEKEEKKNLGHSIHSQFVFISDLMMYLVPVGVSWMPQYVGIC